MRKIAFVLPDLTIGGGTSIALANARHAAEVGLDVSVVLTSNIGDHTTSNVDDGLNVMRFSDATTQEFDVVIASWWRDMLLLPRLSARRRIHFIQGPEDLFYADDDGPRASVRVLYTIPVAAIALSHWLKNYLEVTYSRDVNAVAHPGIDKRVFSTTGPTFLKFESLTGFESSSKARWELVSRASSKRYGSQGRSPTRRGFSRPPMSAPSPVSIASSRASRRHRRRPSIARVTSL